MKLEQQGKRTIELLAPAGSLEVGRVALSAGADAVYIGAPMFGARAARGVSLEDIGALCAEAHQYGAKVYVALNTVLTNDELPKAVELTHRLYDVGADALIVQDFGLCMEELPPIPLHASTQCHNNSLEQLRLLEGLGFEQAVLPREWSTQDIARVQGATSLKLEAFVHGALCVSYSGRCYISQAGMGRSANRGACAQYCRMSYDLQDAKGQTLREGAHLLSLRDLNRSEIIEELLDVGVTSLKIEGRLKGVEYVRNVTAHYRSVLDEIIRRRPEEYCRASWGEEELSFTPNPITTFSRPYTLYNTPLHQPIPVESITPVTNKSVGEELGVLQRLDKRGVEVTLNDPSVELCNGDGLLFVGRASDEVSGAFVNGVAQVGRRGDKVRLLLSQKVEAEVGATVYRNLNHRQLQALRREDASLRKVSLDIACKATESGLQLHGRIVEHPSVEAVVSKAVPMEKAKQDVVKHTERTLRKLGGTIYTVGRLDIETGGYYIPPSVLTELRRELVEALQSEVEKAVKTERLERGTAFLEQRKLFLAQVHLASDFGLPEHLDFTYNVANKSAEKLYRIVGVQGPIDPALEVESPRGDIPVMFTRHCLLHTLGYCTREGRKPPFELPLYLVRGKERFRVSTDCRACMMTLWKEND